MYALIDKQLKNDKQSTVKNATFIGAISFQLLYLKQIRLCSLITKLLIYNNTLKQRQFGLN